MSLAGSTIQKSQGSTIRAMYAAAALAPVGASGMGAAMSFSPVLGTGLALAAGGAGVYDVASASPADAPSAESLGSNESPMNSASKQPSTPEDDPKTNQ